VCDDVLVDDLYRAVGVAEGCMISGDLHLSPGISLHPVEGGVLREAERLLVNEVFKQVHVPAQFAPEQWHINAATNRAVVVAVLHEFPAPAPEAAALGARATIGRILDVLALHREATSRLIATAVARLDGANEPAVFNESPTYRGNLLGGVISGEDASALNDDLVATFRDPVLALWLGMSRDATSEPDPEFAVARWWNLIEAMATARQAQGLVAVDFAGQPLRDQKGRPFTTDKTQARVHEHLRRHFKQHNLGEESWILSDANSPGTGSLWKTLGGWLGLRNAVAHYGCFDPSSSEQRNQGWFQDALDARALDLSKGVHYQRYRIGELARLVLRWEIDAQ